MDLVIITSPDDAIKGYNTLHRRIKFVLLIISERNYDSMGIQLNLFVKLLMTQVVHPTGTSRNNAVDPLPFLYTGLPSLHRPSCNLQERLMKIYK